MDLTWLGCWTKAHQALHEASQGLWVCFKQLGPKNTMKIYADARDTPFDLEIHNALNAETESRLAVAKPE